MNWCSEVDAIDHVGPSYLPTSNGHMSALQLFGFVQHDYRFSRKIIHTLSCSERNCSVPFGTAFWDMLTLWWMPHFQDDIDNFILQLDGAPPYWLAKGRQYHD
ncbi:hypothetical protein TNCV_4366341 [Trichonephila clavipes]|nr:hypothetical protein TNCV_4366341 [Trichonephila clavipes]